MGKKPSRKLLKTYEVGGGQKVRGVLMPKSAGTPDGSFEVWQVSEAGVDKKATIASDARDGEDAVQKAWDTGRKRCSVSAKPKKNAENGELAANFAAELREL